MEAEEETPNDRALQSVRQRLVRPRKVVRAHLLTKTLTVRRLHVTVKIVEATQQRQRIVGVVAYRRRQ